MAQCVASGSAIARAARSVPNRKAGVPFGFAIEFQKPQVPALLAVPDYPPISMVLTPCYAILLDKRL